MTKFELLILKAAIRAQRTHVNMTGRWWLGHGPEHFLSHEVARSIARGDSGNFVYTEISPRKVRLEHQERRRGPVPQNQNQRFDVLVWQKSAARFKAIIEVKYAWTDAPVRSDALKLKKQMKLQGAHGTPYLLAYTEAFGRTPAARKAKVAKRVDDIAKICPRGWIMVGHQCFNPRGAEAVDEDGKIWGWCVCLIRYKNKV